MTDESSLERSLRSAVGPQHDDTTMVAALRSALGLVPDLEALTEAETALVGYLATQRGEHEAVTTARDLKEQVINSGGSPEDYLNQLTQICENTGGTAV